jgi:hypothetical protein
VGRTKLHVTDGETDIRARGIEAEIGAETRSETERESVVDSDPEETYVNALYL